MNLWKDLWRLGRFDLDCQHGLKDRSRMVYLAEEQSQFMKVLASDEMNDRSSGAIQQVVVCVWMGGSGK